jgi:hypothetical protein
MRRTISLLLVVSLASIARGQDQCAARAEGQLIPTDFVGERVFVRWPLGSLGEIRLYTDTGGGFQSLYPAAVKRLGVTVDTTHYKIDTTTYTQMVARVPRSLVDARIPTFPSRDASILKFAVQDEPTPDEEAGYTWDGRLGTDWFADRVWIFDYPGKRLYYNGTTATGPAAPRCWVPLGFQLDSAGKRTNSFPRIAVRIDGESLDLLLDTGARTQLTDGAHRLVSPNEPIHRAASFIVADRFKEWRTRHPDWLVVTGAETGTGFSMIRVPKVEIGTTVIGPVWFTERPNDNFRKFMSQYTDSPIEGALGGSAFRYVTLVLDYPRARAAAVLPSGR